MFLGFYRHGLVVELASPREPHVHFTTFKNSIFVQKQTLVKLLGQMPDHILYLTLSKTIKTETYLN